MIPRKPAPIPKVDKFGVVINHRETYKNVATMLMHQGRCAIAWTDGEGTQLDLVFTAAVPQIGAFQRGINAYEDMVVAVMSRGAFGFALKNWESHAAYVGEKLNLGGVNTTTEALAILLNEIRKEISKQTEKIMKEFARVG